MGLEEDPELLPEMRKEPARTEKKPKSQHLEGIEKPAGEKLNGAGTSMREALEVDEVEEVLHIDGDLQEDLDVTRKDPPPYRQSSVHHVVP